jgi:hypothetical protein
MRAVAGILAAIGWFALALQLRLILGGNDAAGIPAVETLVRFFSYYTILTNVLAALVLTGTVLAHRGTFFSRPSVQTAIAVYISVVGIIYVTILSSLWAPTGPQWLADNLLHHAMPALYVLFWLFFVTKGTLQWKSFLPWLIFPLLYVIVILARGSVSRFWPYPFLDADKLGWASVAQNCALMLALFAAVSLIFIALDRRLPKRVSEIKPLKRRSE